MTILLKGMSRPNNSDMKHDWRRTSTDIGRGTDILEDVETRLMLSLADVDKGSQEETALKKVLKKVEDATREISRLAYLCTPQRS